MSVILNALQKSEAERQRSAAPKPEGAATAPARPPSPRRKWLIGGAVAGNAVLVVVVVWLVTADTSDRAPAVPVAQLTGTETVETPPRELVADWLPGMSPAVHPVTIASTDQPSVALAPTRPLPIARVTQLIPRDIAPGQARAPDTNLNATGLRPREVAALTPMANVLDGALKPVPPPPFDTRRAVARLAIPPIDAPTRDIGGSGDLLPLAAPSQVGVYPTDAAAINRLRTADDPVSPSPAVTLRAIAAGSISGEPSIQVEPPISAVAHYEGAVAAAGEVLSRPPIRPTGAAFGGWAGEQALSTDFHASRELQSAPATLTVARAHRDQPAPPSMVWLRSRAAFLNAAAIGLADPQAPPSGVSSAAPMTVAAPPAPETRLRVQATGPAVPLATPGQFLPLPPAKPNLVAAPTPEPRMRTLRAGVVRDSQAMIPAAVMLEPSQPAALDLLAADVVNRTPRVDLSPQDVAGSAGSPQIGAGPPALLAALSPAPLPQRVPVARPAHAVTTTTHLPAVKFPSNSNSSLLDLDRPAKPKFLSELPNQPMAGALPASALQPRAADLRTVDLSTNDDKVGRPNLPQEQAPPPATAMMALPPTVMALLPPAEIKLPNRRPPAPKPVVPTESEIVVAAASPGPSAPAVPTVAVAEDPLPLEMPPSSPEAVEIDPTQVPPPAAAAPEPTVAALPPPKPDKPKPAEVKPDPLAEIPMLRRMPEAFIAALPALKISMHVYAAESADRLVRLNGTVFREGDGGGDGLVVELILPDGVVMRYQGQRFRVRL